MSNKLVPSVDYVRKEQRKFDPQTLVDRQYAIPPYASEKTLRDIERLRKLDRIRFGEDSSKTIFGRKYLEQKDIEAGERLKDFLYKEQFLADFAAQYHSSLPYMKRHLHQLFPDYVNGMIEQLKERQILDPELNC